MNYDPAAGVLPFAGASKNLTTRLTVRPTKKIKIDETYLFSHLSSLEKSQIAVDYGASAIFNNHLFRSELNYQFTRELSLRSIVDYNGVLPNEALIDLAQAKTVTADFLFTWLLQTGHGILRGIHRYSPESGALPGCAGLFKHDRAGPSTTTGRQLFVKISYLIRR